MVDDQQTREIYDAHVEKQEEDSSKVSETLRNLSQTQLFWIGAVLLYVYWSVSVTEKMSMKSGLFLLAVGAGFVYLVSLREDEGNLEILDEDEAKAILFYKLRWKQKHTDQIPRGNILIPLQCRLQHIDGFTWKWNIYFEIHPEEGGVYMFVAELHPKTGKIIGIIDASEGFTGKEFDDIRWILPREIKMHEKYFSKYSNPKITDNHGGVL